MLKIFQIAPVQSDHLSGQSVYVSELIKCLVKHPDVEVGLLSTFPAEVFDEKHVIPGCTFIKGMEIAHRNPWSIDPVWLNRIEEEFGRPDFVHFHGDYYPMQSALARQMVRRGWKYILSPHGGLQPASQRRKAWKKILGNFFFENAFVRNATAIFVLNEAESVAVKQRYPETRTIIVPNGVSSEILSNASLSRVIEKKDRLQFGFIGRIDIDHKGVDWLLEALLLLEKREPSLPWQLVLVGNFFRPKDEQAVTGLIKRFKDSRRIVLTGPLSGQAKWDALTGFDVFVHTSRYEGMPTSVIEAMAFGKPCLVTPGTNMQGVMEECKGGWNCRADPGSIAQMLCDIVKNPSDIADRGANAREYVRKHLVWDVIAGEYVRQVKSLTNIEKSPVGES